MTQPGPPSTGPPPGWYPDPYGQPGYRWWNGVAWTDDRTAGEAGEGRLMPVGELLGETFRLIGQRIGHLFTLALLLIVVPSVAATGLVLWSVAEVTYADGVWSGVHTDRLALGAVAGLISMVTTLGFMAAVNRHTVAALEGGPEPWSASLAGGLRRTPRVIGANLVVWGAYVLGALAAMVLATAVDPLLLLVVIPALAVAVVIVWVRAGFLTTAASVAPPGRGAIRTSFGVTGGRFWAFLGRFLVVALLYWGVHFVGSFATAPLAGAGPQATEEIVVFDDDGELVRVDLGELITGNLAVVGFSLVVSGLTLAAASAVSAVARAVLYRAAGGPVDPALAARADVGVGG
jgi:hypothetical protein